MTHSVIVGQRILPRKIRLRPAELDRKMLGLWEINYKDYSLNQIPTWFVEPVE